MRELVKRLRAAITDDNEPHIQLTLRWIARGLDACQIDNRIEARMEMLDADSPDLEPWQEVSDMVLDYIGETEDLQ